jgi:hypothetical protein
MARERRAVFRLKLVRNLVFVVAAGLPSCTTYIQPVTCEGPPFSCNERTDVKFCEYEAVALDGPDCSGVGLVASKDFCVVTATACRNTTYAVKDRDCTVLQYRPVREWRTCPAGTPTFNAP